MIAFTISSRNFFALTQTLYESFAQNHPGVPFYAVLADDVGDFDLHAFPFEVIPAANLGLPDLEGMTERYNITEFNTALKPFAFLRLFERHPGESVVYLDPDILVLSRFEELISLLDAGAECVLVPHITEPAEFGEWRDRQALRYGIYNLGFCALRDTPSVRRATWWWARRLETECIIDLENGIFVDQKWADLLPAFIESFRALRHAGYDIAYWNLAQRAISREGTTWHANGVPIRFFHFSGIDPDNPAVVSRHSVQFQADSIGRLADLFADYRSRVSSHGQEWYRAIPYAYRWHGSSGQNLHAKNANSGLSQSSIPYLPVARWSSKADYDVWRHNAPQISSDRVAVEEASIPAEPVFELKGYCAVCGQASSFRTGPMFSEASLPDGRPIPNWREHLSCVRCKTVTRLRGAYQILGQELRAGATADVYVTEAVTPFYRTLRERFPRLIGSEFLSGSRRGGEMVDGVRHEDVQALTFADGSFDLVLSFDVLEHVPHFDRALREFYRCLRPGGELLLTIPFDAEREDHVVRAVANEDGTVEHLLPPEYHGNPVDPEHGSLAYRKFGWKVLDDLRDAGFEDASVLNYWSESLRYFGEPAVAMVAKRPTGTD